jgi:CheY-like chemotaxis protein/HPt (histidine-containing phosphotransfer) domain-containing protein
VNVLVVDDNPAACQLLVAMLQARGVSTTGVRSGPAALQLVNARVQSNLPPFDVVLLDWQMPDMDGWETARHIKHVNFGLHRPSRLVMVTANGRAMLADHTEDEQALLSGFLAKPVSPEMLLEAICEACDDNHVKRKLRQSGREQRGLERMRILVVEDNLLNQQVAEELLSREGALVSLAANGQQGVDAVAAAEPPFDVVLMDLQMPVMDGFAASRMIRQQLGLTTLPIIAMSANVMAADKAESQAAGMTDHVGKPFELAHLVKVLRKHLGWSNLVSEADKKPKAHAAAPQVPSVESSSVWKIDFAQALEWVGGDAGLYRDFAQAYVQDVANYADRLAQHLARGEQIDAVRMMHTLKGLSATVGANTLADFAAKQEIALKNAPLDPQSFDTLVQQTRTGIDAVCIEIGLLIDSIAAMVE